MGGHEVEMDGSLRDTLLKEWGKSLHSPQQACELEGIIRAHIAYKAEHPHYPLSCQDLARLSGD